MTNRLLLLCALPFMAACEPKLVAGTWTCPESTDAGTGPAKGPVTTPWSSGFEDGFCGYTRVGGFCATTGESAKEIVTSPVHSGLHAAAYSLVAGSPGGAQSRCVRDGELPTAAYYGAWYFIPSAPTAVDNWNLFHFQGGEGDPLHGLWDVTITPDADGVFRLSIYDFLHQTWHHAASAVPFGQWFHIQVYLARAAAATGAFRLYQDGQPEVVLEDLITDDTTYGQWYLGNLALGLTPAESTLYVDDVTISDTL